jgi:hypothetical protein
MTYPDYMILEKYLESCREHNLFYLIILNKNLIEDDEKRGYHAVCLPGLRV